ncbi:MAG: DUF6084 family protein [Candidatus Solibacter sp.]
MLDLNFSITGAAPELHAAAPTLNFRLHVRDSGHELIHAILLRVHIQIQPRRRKYELAEQERLTELFGTAERWPDTLRPLLWMQTSLLVPAFRGVVELDLPVACTYDMEVASSKYLEALDEGEIGLLFLFSGTAFLKTENGFRVAQIPWEKEAAFRLPVRTWRETMEGHFPGAGWIRLRRESLDELRRVKAREALFTWDDVILSLVRAKEPVA